MNKKIPFWNFTTSYNILYWKNLKVVVYLIHNVMLNCPKNKNYYDGKIPKKNKTYISRIKTC